MKECFKGHMTKQNLDRAIDELLTASPPLIEVEATKREKGVGSGTKYYKLAANSANCEYP